MKRKIVQIDKRVVKTNERIKESFINLVKLKGYSKVSVSDICKSANINRNTFYLHYKDKEELVVSLLKEANLLIGEYLTKYSTYYKSSLHVVKKVQIQWFFRCFLKTIEPELSFYKIILIDDALIGYMNVLNLMLKKTLTNVLNIQESRKKLMFEYTISGVFGLLKQWIIYEPISKYETARLLSELCYNNLKQLESL